MTTRSAFDMPDDRDTARATRGALLRDVLRARRERRSSRVVPLPLAVAAILFPFLCAWAAGTDRSLPATFGPVHAVAVEGGPLEALARERRVPNVGQAYVDIHGVPEGWEAALLDRRGYVGPSAAQSAQGGR